MKTPDEARKAWVEALRSGEYKQGKAFLNVGERYCCLGVACRLAIADGVAVAVEERGEGHPVLYGEESGWVPDAVREWLGLSTDTGDYTARNGRETSLANRNDSGAPFKRIADIIESKPKGLFVAPEAQS